MAAVTHRALISTTTNASSYASASFTPTAGDLLVVAFSPGALVGTSPSVTGSANGMTFTEVTAAADIRAVVDDVRLFVSDQLVPASPVAMTVTASPGGSASGLIGFVASVSGLSLSGLSAVRGAVGNHQATGATPTATLPAAALTANPVLAFVWNATSPSGVTIPTSFTLGVADTGYSTPTRGGRYAFRNSGHTSATVTWGSTSATASANIFVEFDTSAAGSPATGTGALLLDGTSAATAPTSATGAITLAGSSSALVPTSATGALTLSGGSAGAAATSATGAVTLSGSAAGGATDSGTGAVVLAGSSTAKAATSGTGAIVLDGTGVASGGGSISGTGALSLAGSSSAAAAGSATGALALVGNGTDRGAGSGTGAVTLTGSSSDRAGGSGTGVVAIIGSSSGQAPGSAIGTLLLGGTATAGGGTLVDVTVLSVTEFARSVAIVERQRLVTFLEAQRTVTITAAQRTVTITEQPRALTIQEAPS